MIDDDGSCKLVAFGAKLIFSGKHNLVYASEDIKITEPFEEQRQKIGRLTLKILLSAYACQPGEGSEPGIGWHWAVEIARLGHEVHILTRANNVDGVKRGLAELGGLPLTVCGYDLPRWARWWKKGPRGVRLYYVLWQWGAYRKARKLHDTTRFDLVHHITFGVFRHPSFMGRLGIPFIFGPVGGGEYAPHSLLGSLPLRGRITERLRSAANRLALLDPLVRITLRQADLICCNTPETLAQLPKSCRRKSICVHDVAIDGSKLTKVPSTGHRPQFLFVGRLLYWKGIHLALRAVAELRRNQLEVGLTVVGAGGDQAWLQSMARELRLDQAVQWRGWIPRDEVLASYASHAAFLFPSLHDSGGMVVMEAMSQGLPVICLNLGGPGAILPENCGFKICARNRTEAQVVDDLAEAMKKLITDRALRDELAVNALEAARRQTWAALVTETYEQIQTRVATR